MLAALVSSLWMYPFKCYLVNLKKYVKNKVKPEELIVEGYAIDETLTSCYFSSLMKRIDLANLKEILMVCDQDVGWIFFLKM